MLKAKDYKRLIDEGGLRRDWIAKRIGVSKGMISLFLNGKRRMSQENINKLNDALRERGIL